MKCFDMEIDTKKLNHYRILNGHMRKLEEEIFNKVEKITQHLIRSIAEGVEEYRNFVVEGLLVAEPFGDDVPKEVTNRFLDLQEHIVTSTTEEYNETRYQEIREYARNYDEDYINHPEEYVEGYIPMTRAWDWMFEEAMAHNRISYDDLLFVQPRDIRPQIAIMINL